MRPEHADVVIVGARCAGASLAALLARRGLRVALLERATFPHDTLSSHLFEADTLAFLDRLGVIGKLRDTGAPLVSRGDIQLEDLRWQMTLPQRPGDVGAMASVRRLLLDQILVEAAAEAGASIRMNARVTGLINEDGRIAGVRVREGAREAEVRARLVVGADGSTSTVVRLLGLCPYNPTGNERMLFWAYFEGADLGSEPTFVTCRRGDRFVLAIPCDSGLYQVVVGPGAHERERFKRERDAPFMDHAYTSEPVANALTSAKRVGKMYGSTHWKGFFRQAAGRGWVLSGDAGHPKSPAPGRGIGDALLQGDALATAIVEGIEGSDDELDRATREWGRWRDREFAEHYWLAYELERAGAVPPVLVEVVRGLLEEGRAAWFFDVFNHRRRPTEILTPIRVATASARLLFRGSTDRRALLADLVSLGARELHHRWLNVHPTDVEVNRRRRARMGLSGSSPR